MDELGRIPLILTVRPPMKADPLRQAGQPPGRYYIDGERLPADFVRFAIPAPIRAAADEFLDRCKKAEHPIDTAKIRALLHVERRRHGGHYRAFEITRNGHSRTPYRITGLANAFCSELPKLFRVRMKPGDRRYFQVTAAEVLL